MAGDYFEIKVRLTADQATERISSVLGKNGFLASLTEDTPLIGEIAAPAFQARKRAYNKNSWRPTLYGSIESTSFGCIIRGQFKLHKYIRTFTIFLAWVVFLLLATAAMMVCEGLLRGAFSTKIVIDIIGSLTMVVILILITIVAKISRKEEEEFIRQIMQELFKDTIIYTSL